ncbi:MAG TPA: hypothetical protein VFD43_04090 [Planctomycetota bacterium]|nr:hypothetical protein [Planctomycetota bacterium]
MRLSKSIAVALGVALVAVPAIASIKAMTLKELMAVTTEVVDARIVAKRSFKLDWPMEGAVYTGLSIEGVSLRTLEPVKTEVVFLGSHDPADQFGTSEMPTLQDTRVGSQAVIFYAKDQDIPGRLNVVYDLSGVYRGEQAFGAPVVVGKGEGFAFAENVKLGDVRTQVRTAHLELAAEQAGK